MLAMMALAAPAAADAASVSVTGDDGNPIAVAPGAPPTIRNMRPDVGVAFPPGDGRYKITITNAAGNAVNNATSCRSRSLLGPYTVEYTGNGAYVVTITNFAANDFNCVTPQTTETFGFFIAASTAVTAPATHLLRAPGSFATNPLAVSVAQNPGASSLEVRFAPFATIGPDGAIAGNSTRTIADSATGVAQLRFDGPGVYTVVARPTRFSSAGEVGGPWSAPVRVVVLAPFDISGGLQFLDSRGPSYSVRIQLREKSARGRVSVALARGSRGGKYRSLGSAKISSLGTVTKRFRARRAGAYRLRFSYRGAQSILGGRAVFPIRIRRTISFG